MKVRVDPERCQGHTLCAMIAPDMFQLSELDGSAAASTEEVPPEREEQAREAAQSCPEQAITIEDDRNGSPVPSGNRQTREMTS